MFVKSSCWFEKVREVEFQWDRGDFTAIFRGDFLGGDTEIVWTGEAAHESHNAWVKWFKEHSMPEVRVIIPPEIYQKISQHLTD